jgi:hypothetical protein
MLRAFPQSRLAWQNAVLFPFQAFPFVAFIVGRYFASVWPPHTRWSMDDLKLVIIGGDSVCVTTLLCVALFQLFTGDRRAACLNSGLAALTVLWCLPFLSFVRT